MCSLYAKKAFKEGLESLQQQYIITPVGMDEIAECATALY